MPAYRDSLERFSEKFAIDENGCWLWTAALQKIGYGQFWTGQSSRAAHRWLWEYLFGPVPAGLELDHLCRVRRCVNPDHLEPVTHAENMRRGISAGEKKAHCPRGHAYTPENTYVLRKKNGRTARNCRACVRDATRRYRETGGVR